MVSNSVDYRALTPEQLIARLQIAESETRRLSEANAHLHRMMETLRDNGWAHPRPADLLQVNIKRYPMPNDPRFSQPPQPDPQRASLARQLKEANERADHWRQKYIDLLDSTGRNR